MNIRRLPIGGVMRARRAVVLLAFSASLLTPASSLAAHSVGTPEQIAWVRRAARNFVNAEIAGNGAGACGILNAPLRATRNHRTCEQRWDARLKSMLRSPAERRLLRAQRRAIAAATVIVHGNVASLAVKTPLFNGPNHFLWTEMCWMLEG
jgi:hypothetical protein